MTDWQILNMDVMDGLRSLPDGSVHCVITSPPYFGLRDYSVPGQIGLEPTPAEFVQTMVRVFREVRRVLRPEGSCWVNLGDSYAQTTVRHRRNTVPEGGNTYSYGFVDNQFSTVSEGLKPKDLMMMPARVALALQEDGWWLRSDIIYCKRAPMPESVTDRPTTAHEHIFLLTKQPRYFYDADAIREPLTAGTLERGYAYADRENYVRPKAATADPSEVRGYGDSRWSKYTPTARNAWSYWLLSPEPFPAAHFATFPTEIPRRAILAGTSEHGVCAECGVPWRRVVERSIEHVRHNWAAPKYTKGDNLDGVMGAARFEGGHLPGHTVSNTTGWQPTCSCGTTEVVPATVLDIFSGAGTTVLVANRLGRRGIGIELSAEYCEMSRRRIIGDAPLFNWQPEEQGKQSNQDCSRGVA